MPSRALGPAGEHCVFVFLHRTREDTVIDYNRTTREYLEENFLHPMFLFLRPDLTEIDKSLRHEHEYVSASQIVNHLKKNVWPVSGKGLKPKDWEKAKDQLAKANEALAAGDLRVAETALKPVLKLKPPCGVKDRAAMILALIESRRELTEAWAALVPTLEDPPAGIAESLAAGDLLGARRTLRKARRPSLDDFAGKVETGIRKHFAVDLAEDDLLIMSNGAAHYLETTLRCGLARVENVTLEVSVISTTGDILEGNGRIPLLTRSSRILACASLAPRALSGNLVQSMRVRLFLGDLLLAEGTSKVAPPKWPARPARKKHETGPDFLDSDAAFHAQGDVEIVEIRVGRVF